MKMQQLEYFVTVSKCGSLGKAAEKLFTTQPNVSKVIHSLEVDLGTELFERNPRGLKLNEYGKSIYDYAENILKNADFITTICSQHIPDTFNISTFQSNSLARLLVDLYLEYPEIRINHRQGNIEEIIHNVEDGTSEIGIIYISHKHRQSLNNILTQKHLEFIETGSANACISVGPKSPYYNRDSIDYSEISNMKFTGGIQDYFSENTFSRSNLGVAGTDALSVCVSSNCNQMLSMVARETDLAYFTISCLYKGDYISDGVKRVKITGDEASLAYGYIHEKDHMLSDAAACCIDLVTRYYVPEI